MARVVTVRTILTLVAAHNWDIQHMDVVTNQGDLLEEVYIDIPQGFGNSERDLVCRLHKFIYGRAKTSPSSVKFKVN